MKTSTKTTTKTASNTRSGTRKSSPRAGSKQTGENALKKLFVDGLKDILWAEKHLTKALKKLAKEATSDQLKEAFTEHMQQTEGHIERLDKVFASVGEKATAKKCDGMEGLSKEADSIIEETEKGTETRDAGLIAAAQKVEHYEIASYGTLRTLAGVLGFTEAQQLLDQTLQEEKETDTLLTSIAESFVNESALTETA